jgi:hypothetical protein
MTQLNLSALADHFIFKLACTIANLAGCEEIQSVHLAEALQYRPKLMLSQRLIIKGDALNKFRLYCADILPISPV